MASGYEIGRDVQELFRRVLELERAIKRPCECESPSYGTRQFASNTDVLIPVATRSNRYVPGPLVGVYHTGDSGIAAGWTCFAFMSSHGFARPDFRDSILQQVSQYGRDLLDRGESIAINDSIRVPVGIFNFSTVICGIVSRSHFLAFSVGQHISTVDGSIEALLFTHRGEQFGPCHAWVSVDVLHEQAFLARNSAIWRGREAVEVGWCNFPPDDYCVY
ncbi:hypothetical protein Spb1_20210 [Planctopirus ephydatiae]|uniref:Uncharacterized protein n=1 Tax=Planctopirus ephydatiae TaxID=2528019 RepID=A0A518GN73_9PLAN|nr:hypothetical protein Spb1_20210 [Planctopirus ephydatiae]